MSRADEIFAQNMTDIIENGFWDTHLVTGSVNIALSNRCAEVLSFSIICACSLTVRQQTFNLC